MIKINLIYTSTESNGRLGYELKKFFFAKTILMVLLLYDNLGHIWRQFDKQIFSIFFNIKKSITDHTLFILYTVKKGSSYFAYRKIMKNRIYSSFSFKSSWCNSSLVFYCVVYAGSGYCIKQYKLPRTTLGRWSYIDTN